MLADGQKTIDLAKVWEALLARSVRVVCFFNTDDRLYLLYRVVSAEGSRSPIRAEILERLLLGESQKRIAIECDGATSTISIAAKKALRAMGVQVPASRAPLILAVLVHAYHGRTTIAQGCVHPLFGGSIVNVLSVPRAEALSCSCLTACELDVVRQLANGTCHAEIARRRHVSARTVANQLASAFRKLRISGRTELLGYLARGGDVPSVSFQPPLAPSGVARVSVGPSYGRRPSRRAPATKPSIATLAALLALAGTNLHVHCATAAPSALEASALREFETGLKLFDDGRFADALAAFQKSSATISSPNTRLYIARCLRALGKTASAYTAYRLSSREAADRASAGERRYIATSEGAAAEGAELEHKVPRLSIALPVSPPSDLRIAIDDVVVHVDAPSSEFELDPGSHVVTASASHHESFRASIELREDDKRRVEVVSARLPMALVSLVLRELPAGLAISLDGRPLSPEAHASPYETPVGRHVVDAHAPGYVPFHLSFDVRDDETRQVFIGLSPRDAPTSQGGTPPWMLLTSLGVGVAGITTGVVLAAGANSDAKEQMALDPLERRADVRDDIDHRSTIANIAFGAGALGLAGAGVLFFTTRWSRSESTGARFAPIVGTSVAGLRAAGTF
jgi:DNA-binding NarL/FixJ family response regulator